MPARQRVPIVQSLSRSIVLLPTLVLLSAAGTARAQDLAEFRFAREGVLGTSVIAKDTATADAAGVA